MGGKDIIFSKTQLELRWILENTAAGGSQFFNGFLSNKDDLKNKDNLKNEENLKNEDRLINKDYYKNKDNLIKTLLCFVYTQ